MLIACGDELKPSWAVIYLNNGICNVPVDDERDCTHVRLLGKGIFFTSSRTAYSLTILYRYFDKMCTDLYKLLNNAE